MKNFKVHGLSPLYPTILVQANNEDEARDKAWEELRRLTAPVEVEVKPEEKAKKDTNKAKLTPKK